MTTLLPNGRVDHWIDGRRVAPRSGNYLPSIDPSLGTPWIEVPAGDADDTINAGVVRLIGTTFGMNVGETVVVGTSKLNGGSEALVVLLTATP